MYDPVKHIPSALFVMMVIERAPNYMANMHMCHQIKYDRYR